MTAIWRNDGREWTVLAPSRFPDEATLHRLIEDAPHLLPLAGSPQLIVVGREVRLGAGYADLIAVEPDGRLCVIEIKLAKNAEARKAVVAQALAYAAFLYRLEPEQVERDVLRAHLQGKGFTSLAEAVNSEYQEGDFDTDEFVGGLRNCLAQGHLRVVFVLDEAPPELVQLLGFLEAVSDGLILDLVTISAYDVNGSQILVPQRVEPEKAATAVVSEVRPRASQGTLTTGPDAFIADVADADATSQPQFQELISFARKLESAGFAELSSFRGVNEKVILLPRLQPDNVGLISIWNDRGPAIQLWRSVFERKAPSALRELEAFEPPVHVGQGNYLRRVDPQILNTLWAAYAEANNTAATAVRDVELNGVLTK
jgi:hypothetical protein